MDEQKVGSTRRDLLKKAAVGGAVTLALPAIISSPAFAASRKCSISAGCTKYYYVKAANLAIAPVLENSSNLGGSCTNKTLTELQCNPPQGSPTFGYGGALPGFLFTFVTNSSYSFTLPAGSIPIFLNSHFGQAGCLLWAFGDNGSLTSSATQNCLTVTKSGTVASGITVMITSSVGCDPGWSGLMIYFCN